MVFCESCGSAIFSLLDVSRHRIYVRPYTPAGIVRRDRSLSLSRSQLPLPVSCGYLSALLYVAAGFKRC